MLTVILDRDGTIIVDKNYLADPAQIELLPGAAEGLRRLREHGYQLIIASNQSGIGRSYFSEADYEKVTARLLETLREQGVEIAGAYYCPHAPETACACRKPQIGMITQAARELNFNPADTVVIGDKAIDIEFGKNLGAALTILVRTGYGAATERAQECAPDAVVDDLRGAAAKVEKIICEKFDIFIDSAPPQLKIQRVSPVAN